MTTTFLQQQVLNWWSFSYIILANLFALLFHLFINQWRQNDHIYSSAARKKNINSRILIMRVRIFSRSAGVSGVHRCVVNELYRSRFQSVSRKVTMWQGDWQRLATRHQGKMWPLQMVTAAGRRSLSHCQKHKLAAWERAVHWAKYFVHRIVRIWTRFTMPSGCSSASSKFILSWRNKERAIVKAWQKLPQPHGAVVHQQKCRWMAPSSFVVRQNGRHIEQMLN